MNSVTLSRLRITSSRALLALTVMASATACNSSDANSPLQVATSVTLAPGTQTYSATAGQRLPDAVGVLVKDQNGNPMENATVNWTVGFGGGQISRISSFTDANGIATVNWTFGETAGAQTLIATIQNGQSVTINGTATVGAFQRFEVVGENTGTLSSSIPTKTLTVRASDQYGNALAGVPVTWTTTGGTLSSASSTTDANGLATITYTSPATAGVSTVTAKSGDQTLTYTLTRL